MKESHNEFKDQLATIKASPLHKTDREILIKIAKLSLKDGYCYMSQKQLAAEIHDDLGSGSLPTLQRHLYRLQAAKILRADINAGERGQNYYQVDWDILKSLPEDFKLPPFLKNDDPEAKQERLAKLKEHRQENDCGTPNDIENAMQMVEMWLKMIPALIATKAELIEAEGLEVYENTHRFLLANVIWGLAETIGYKVNKKKLFSDEVVGQTDVFLPRISLGEPTDPTSPSEGVHDDPHHPHENPTSPSVSDGTTHITLMEHPHHGHITLMEHPHHFDGTPTSPSTEGDVQTRNSGVNSLVLSDDVTLPSSTSKIKNQNQNPDPEPSTAQEKLIATSSVESLFICSVKPTPIPSVDSRPSSQNAPQSSAVAAGEAEVTSNGHRHHWTGKNEMSAEQREALETEKAEIMANPQNAAIYQRMKAILNKTAVTA